jgi:LmbE family N-acetylglucosaminyl deacetylase
MTSVPSAFLLHAVGVGPDDATRDATDDALREVELAGSAADIGRSAPAFREGQGDVADAMPAAELERLRATREALDPDRVLIFHRHPVSLRRSEPGFPGGS